MCSTAPKASNDPAAYQRGREYIVNTDVEDIYKKQWDSAVSLEDLPRFQEMALFLIDEAPRNERELCSAVILMRRQFKHAPKRSQLGHALRSLQAEGRITPQPELLKLCGPLGTLPARPALSWPLPSTPAVQQAITAPTHPRTHPPTHPRTHAVCRLIKKAGKSTSGVLVVTVLTSPRPTFGPPEARTTQKFSCAWNCYYCPNEPKQPRSYLHDEPSVLRANQNGFDAVLQFTERVATLVMNGHPPDKVELLVLGGTWTSYPHAYQEEFCRDLFYAANTFSTRGGELRPRLSLEEEQAANEGASCKIIGLTLETRPDCIDAEELRRLRRYGCTRVQLGVQHTDDSILRKINRGCTNADTERALRLLKDACYKVDIHLMPNLPGSDPERDAAMFTRVLGDEALQADQWKIYPCEVTPWTVIKKWFDQGDYVPYSEAVLCEMLIGVKSKVHPWIRLNRVVRDIPSQYILGGVDAPNMRQQILEKMAREGKRCRCIRCREVGTDSEAMAPRAVLVRRHYRGSGGDEVFLSFEADDEKDRGREVILGFLRLRFSARAGMVDDEEGTEPVFPELQGAALIRELHVYGQLVATGATKDANGSQVDDGGSASQHQGFGRRLLAEAQVMARRRGYTRLAVISGVGTRQYYRKHGYEIAPGPGLTPTPTPNPHPGPDPDPNPNPHPTPNPHQVRATSWSSLCPDSGCGCGASC